MEDLDPEGVFHNEENSNTTNVEVDLIMATMLDPEARRCFGPRRSRPSTTGVTRALRRRASGTSQQTFGATSTRGGEDRFPLFNPESDIRVGQFVAFSVKQSELCAGVPFYMRKVLEFGQRKWVEKIKVIWY